MPQGVNLDAYARATVDAGLRHFPWELDAAAAMYARSGDRWQFPDVCIVVARRNGKTTLVLPRIIEGLRRGEKILHTAHNRDLPRETFVLLASLASKLFPEFELKVRWANGQEIVELNNGAHYRIASDRQGGGRGHGADLVIVDELREQKSNDLIAALTPTLADSKDGQSIYLSNAGDDSSVILNDLRARRDTDPNLCYLEWSAHEDRDMGDRDGWREANPALPQMPWMMQYLETQYTSRPQIFETEHLCRWVHSMAEAFVSELAWHRCQVTEFPAAHARRYMGVALDPSGKRAAAALAWQNTDGSVSYAELGDWSDEAGLDLDPLGVQIRNLARLNRVRETAYSAVADVALARYLTKAKPIDGRLFANASATFATLVETRQLRYVNAEALTDDLRWSSRHQTGATWSAVRAVDDHPIPATLAAIRAVWLASAPKPAGPRIA